MSASKIKLYDVTTHCYWFDFSAYQNPDTRINQSQLPRHSFKIGQEFGNF